MNIEKIKNNKKLYLIIALAAGVLMVTVSGLFPDKKESLPNSPPASTSPDTASVERRLKELIETIEGISDVSVFVTYDNMGEKRIAVTSEESVSSDGNKRNSSLKSQVVTAKGSTGEEPFVSEEILPVIRGVIICAKGVGNEDMRLIIADAVSGAMNVPIHRVKVLSKD